MIENIRRELEAMKDISGWKLERIETEGLEAYVTGGNLEMGRAKNVLTTIVTVYRDSERDGEKLRGSATAKIYPGTSAEEIRFALARIAVTASHVGNPWFPLVRPSSKTRVKKTAAAGTLAGLFEGLVPELRVSSPEGNGKLAYAELIMSRNSVRLLNSEGIDESFSVGNGYFECAAHWKDTGREEVEIFSQLNFSDPEPGLLSSRALESLARARDRSRATPNTARDGIKVILSGSAVPELFSYFAFQISAASVYKKLSVVNEGYRFQKDPSACDAVTLSYEPALAGSPASRPFDRDGFPLEPHLLIENGTVKKLAGDVRHAHYLGIEPTGDQANVTVGGGSLEPADLEREECLEITDFSDFSMDPVTGNFGGEIRLAYLRGNGERKPVTGGSISGRMSSTLDTMRFSKAVGRHENFFGPLFLRLENVSVSAG